MGHIINDMQAAAERIAEHLNNIEREKVIQNINGAKFILLQDNYSSKIEYADSGVAMILQAGTGFGLATLITSKTRSILLPSESKSIPFAPNTDEEFEYYDFLTKKDRIITLDKVLSAEGLLSYAKFIGCKANTSEEVSQTYEEDMRAREAVHFYLKLHARYLAHFCNVFLPYRGVFITGHSIIANLRGILSSDYIGTFKKNLDNKNLEHIPIYLVEEHNINLKGALALAKSKTEKKQKIMIVE